MELYILSKQDLSILSICKLADYQINLDEETNAKSTFTLMKTNGLKKENYMVLNGLYRQFIFVIDDVQTEKESDVVTVTALDISNVFNRKVIEKNIDTMKSKSIEEFLANTISENFVNSDDTALNVNYIEIYWHTNTQGNVATNAENGLYNFHTFLINCRQYKNIYTDFKLENLGNPQTVEGKRINVEAKNRKIVDISLHGESTQNGTPTPDNRVEIENIEGKNLFNINGNRIDYNATSSIINDTLKIITSGNYARADYLNIEIPKTAHTISFNWESDTFLSGTDARIYVYDGATVGTMLTYSNLVGVSGKVSLTFTNTTGVISMRFSPNNTATSKTITMMLTNIQLEEGTVATPYVPYNSLEFKVTNGLEETDENYQEQVATFPLSEGQKLMEGSYLADDGTHHKRKQVVLDGSREYIRYTSLDSANYNCFYTNQSDIYVDSTGTQTCLMSNYFKGDKFDNRALDIPNMWVNKFASQIYFKVPNTITTVEELTTLFAEQYANGTPVIVEYELAEEEIVPYTTAQQEAWNKIKNITLFEGVNHISSEANMVLKYYPLKTVGLKFVLRIDIENKQETTKLIDTTLPEVTDYNKIYEEDVTAKVTAYIRENNTEYNLYLKTDRTTTTNKNDPDRASGKIEVISVDTVENAPEEALNVMKGNNYKHLVEFKIAKTSKLMDITELHIGRPIRIKTDDDIYDSYISAITLSDENFVCFKSGRLRITLLDKLKQKFLQIT